MNRLYSMGKNNTLAAMFPAMVLLMAMMSSLVFVEPAPVDVVTMGCAGLMFIAGLRIPREFFMPLFFLGLFLLGNLLSAAFVENYMEPLIYLGVTAYLVIALVMYTSLMYYDFQKLMPLFWTGYIFAALLATITAIIGFFELVWFHEMFTRNDRAAGTFKDPNVFGPFLIAVTLYLINTVEWLRGWRRWGAVALIALFVFGLLISFSRGAIGNFLLALLILLLIKLKLKNSYRTFLRYLGIGMLVTALSLAVLSVAFVSTDRLATMFELRAKVVQDYDIEESGRFYQQQVAIELFSGNPIGIGPGMSGKVMGMEPHNVYLLVLVENGILGFIGWVGFFLLTLTHAIRFILKSKIIPPDFLPIFATLIATLLQSFLIDSIHWRHLFILSGIIWGITLAVQRQQKSGINVFAPTPASASLPLGGLTSKSSPNHATVVAGQPRYSQ